MEKQDLYEKSPVRLFDSATEGGLKAGELGLVTSKKGLGKTSVLVQFGMDTLLQDKQLVHVSFDLHSSNVISWYDGIFAEIAKKKNIGNTAELKGDVVAKRTILNFSLDNFNLSKVVNTLNALKAGGIAVAGVVIDGVDFAKVKESDIQSVSSYAKATKTKIWISAAEAGDKLEESAPKAILPYFTAVIHLAAKGKETVIQVLKMGKNKDIETTLKLDSKTSLIVSK